MVVNKAKNTLYAGTRLWARHTLHLLYECDGQVDKSFSEMCDNIQLPACQIKYVVRSMIVFGSGN